MPRSLLRGNSLGGRTIVSLQGPREVESPSAPADISASTVNSVSPSRMMVGFDYDLCFNVTVDSPDAEYMDRFLVDLPDDWTIAGIYPVPDNGCGLGTIVAQDPGNVAYWQVDAPLPSGCGAWSNGTYDFCVRISVPDCISEPWYLPWHILGDGFPGTPDEVSGVAGPFDCLPPGIYLTPENILSSGCPGVLQEFTLNLFNYTFADTTFNLTYEVTVGKATLTGPDQIYLGHGVDQDLTVVLTPWACLRNGEEVAAWAVALGNSYGDSTLLYRTINLSPTCPDSGCQFIYLPLTLRDF